MSGPTMDFWYPTCAAVFDDLSTPYIMSAALLRTHSMQISYADSPGPTVTIEQGKRFPFFNHLQVGNDNGKMLYPKWKVFGDFLPPQPSNTIDCQNVLLQAGDHGPEQSGTEYDQGESPRQGGGPTQGGPTCDRGHAEQKGEVECEETPPMDENDFEHVSSGEFGGKLVRTSCERREWSQMVNAMCRKCRGPARDYAKSAYAVACVVNR